MATTLQHELTLKVMRLSRPQFSKETASLILPSSFGNIYLGELFSCYLSLNNDSQSLVDSVSIKAELQTASMRLSLFDSSESTSLMSSQSSEFVINHEIKELGTHVLVCSISYSVNQVQKTFRKFYKFQVLNPLFVKTKIRFKNSVLIEAQIQNTTSSAITITSINFDPNPLFYFVSLNNHGNLVNSMDIVQYLYKLVAIEGKKNEAYSSLSLGKLDIRWRSSMGQTGRLQTAQLTTGRKVDSGLPVSITVLDVPDVVYSEEAFTLKLVVCNNQKNEANVTINTNKSKMSSILVDGRNEVVVGIMEPEEKRVIEMKFFALVAGLHGITGISIKDGIGGSTSDVESLVEVFVMDYCH